MEKVPQMDAGNSQFSVERDGTSSMIHIYFTFMSHLCHICNVNFITSIAFRTFNVFDLIP